MNPFGGFATIFRTLGLPNFGIYTAGSSVSLIGTWMQRVGTGWLTWELTGSGAWLGVIAFANLAPAVLVGPVAGAAADRWDRLRVNKVTQGLGLIQSLILFLLTASDAITIYLLLALTTFLGVAEAFNQPARLALISSLVPRPNLSSAVAINSLVFNLARFVGPAIAGLIIVQYGVPAIYAANAATYAAFLFALWQVRLHAMPGPALERASFATDLVQGIRYTAAHPGIRPMLLLMIAASIGCRPVVELLPGFAAAVFGSGAAGLALFTSSIGVGAIIGGLWLGGRTQTGGLTSIVLANTLMLAVTVILFTATANIWLAALTLAAAGFCMSATGISMQTLIHLNALDAMRGRVLSIHGLIFRGGPALGALLMGGISEVLGLRWPVFLGALAATFVWVWAYLRRRRIAEALGGA